MHPPTWSPRTTGLALVLLAAAGCSPYPTMQGLVRGAHDRCAPASGGAVAMGAPLPSATVRVICPGAEAPLGVAETDAEGRFQGRWAPSGAIPMRCTIRVERAGYAPRDVPVADVCTSPKPKGEAGCWSIAVVAELAAAGGAP